MARNKNSSTDIIESSTVKKHVGAIHTSGELTLLERKIVNVLLLNAYKDLVTRRTHRISVPLMCAMLGYNSNDTQTLKDALRTLASTTVEFNVMEDGKEKWKVMSMISFGEIAEGVCTYRYDEYLAERLYDPEIYATINLAVQRKFDSSYALKLYENCLRYKNVGSTGWFSIDRFRTLLGAKKSMYDEFKYLKRDVIAKPVAQINRVSDIRIEAEFKKSGRSVTDVRFLVNETTQQSLLSAEATDEYAEVRAKPTYQRLIDHGIGDRLAILWLVEDEKHVSEVIDYVEKRDQQKKVKSTGGLIRSLIDSKAEVGESSYEKKKREHAEKVKTKAVEVAIKQKTDEERRTSEDDALWNTFLNNPDEIERAQVIEAVLKDTSKFVRDEYKKRALDSVIVRANIIVYLRRKFDEGQGRAGEQ